MVDSHESDDVRIGRILRARRTALGLTQADIGVAAGVTAQQVQKYESGVNSIVPSRLSRIARALDVPVSFFFPDERNISEGAVTGGSQVGFTGESQSIELLTSFQGVADKDVRALFVKLLQRVEKLLKPDSQHEPALVRISHVQGESLPQPQ